MKEALLASLVAPAIRAHAFLGLVAPLLAQPPALPPVQSGVAEPSAAEGHREPVSITGTVLLPDGRPALDAVVVSSAGGSAVVGQDGAFLLELEVDPAAADVEVTAVANGPQGSLVASRRVDGLRPTSTRDAGTLHLAVSQGCAPDWLPTFGGPEGTNGEVFSFAVYDDGSGAGPALYVGGAFTCVGGLFVGGIARWDGQDWSALGGGTNGFVDALAVFDDGSGGGPALYAGGNFGSVSGVAMSSVAKWNGQSWSGLEGGVNGIVFDFAVHDDGGGAGPALYVAGGFSLTGSGAAKGIARWNGTTWSALGGGLTGGYPFALSSFDDGSGAGAALYAAGSFTTAGGQSASRIARWDGLAWSALGTGASGDVFDLRVFDDGSGAALYAGGVFESVDGVTAHGIARWDGQAWSGLGTGGIHLGVGNMVVLDDGSGPALCVGGYFEAIPGAGPCFVAKWDGQWTELADDLAGFGGEAVHALGVYDDGRGAGALLYAGGGFTTGDPGVEDIAAWDGQDWSGLGIVGQAGGLNGEVRVLTVYDDLTGAGPALVAGGTFTEADGQTVNGVAKWDGTTWSPLGGGIGISLTPSVDAMTVFDDGTGPALYAGGSFTLADGQPALNVAKWDGQAWTQVGGGLGDPFAFQTVHALAVYDDGSGAGPALYAGGSFPLGIAKWDGQAWTPVGGGVSDMVNTLVVADDGSGAGPALCVGGFFQTAGGLPALNIARWDGQSWSTFGQGIGGIVYALAMFDEGTGHGPVLFAGGQFIGAGTTLAKSIARWDGQSWSKLGSGLLLGTLSTAECNALTVHDDGSGPALYVAGMFNTAAGVNANCIARWDGQTWSALGDSLYSRTNALAVFDDGLGPALFVGGQFPGSPAGDAYLAKWGCQGISTIPGCFDHPAGLASVSSAASIGDPFELSLSTESFTSGLGLLYFGLEGADATGCGILVPGIGELLLAFAPLPQQVAAGVLSAGSVGFVLPVPDVPAFVGVQVAFQGVTVGTSSPGLPIGMSNALQVTITP